MEDRQLIKVVKGIGQGELAVHCMVRCAFSHDVLGEEKHDVMCLKCFFLSQSQDIV
jgi:hypothetical protein